MDALMNTLLSFMPFIVLLGIYLFLQRQMEPISRWKNPALYQSITISRYQKRLPLCLKMVWPLVMLGLCLLLGYIVSINPNQNPNHDSTLTIALAILATTFILSLPAAFAIPFTINNIMIAMMKSFRLDYNFIRNFYAAWTLVFLFFAVVFIGSR